MPNLKRLGLLQGLWISFLDLIHNAIGFPRANLWSFGGVLLFEGFVTLISEPCLSPSQNAAVGAMGKANKKGKGIKCPDTAVMPPGDVEWDSDGSGDWLA
jgi:hypothetical protein